MTTVEAPFGLESASRPGSSARPQASIQAIVAHARAVPSVERERFARELAALPEAPGHVVIHTCHRVELYSVPGAIGDRLPDPPAGAETLADADAVGHLISVACGLDSAVVGETQILHQLRETVAERQGDRSLDPALDRLFQVALHSGRTAHGWFTGSPRSLADVALDRIAATLPNLDGRRILVVGVGKMGRLAAFAAARRGMSVIVSNRTAERAAALAREVGGRVAPFGGDDAIAPIGHLDGVIVAIAGEWMLGPLDLDALDRSQAAVVDLSSPPAVPPELGRALGSRLVSVDDLADDEVLPGDRIRRRLEKLISDSGRSYCTWLRTRDAVPAIHAVVTTAETLRRAELDRLRARADGMSEEDLALVEQMSHRLVAAILHAPLAALNGDTTGDLERAARQLFDL